MSLFHLLVGPPAYEPRTGWPALAAVPTAILMFLAAALVGGLAAQAYVHLFDMAPVSPTEMSLADGGHIMRLLVWLAGLQLALVSLTVLAAGFFSSVRKDTLALRPPAQGPRVFAAALAAMVLFAAVFTTLVLSINPDALLRDLKPFATMMRSEAWWLTLLVAGIGAPIAEELLFRGFLFSALARSRVGLWGATLITTTAWTVLHAGYSEWGLLEVFLIGLYFSWLMVRTGSLWVPMLCHGAYNTMLIVGLALVPLPA